MLEISSVPNTANAQAEDAASDRAALIALYNATDGPNWENQTNCGSATCQSVNGTVSPLDTPTTISGVSAVTPFMGPDQPRTMAALRDWNLEATG
ncbi:MAG: hypothetical protein OXD31_13555 [Chloroflexi bacterium]|nr:hypothetical protein [Chloroflexota bacterium]